MNDQEDNRNLIQPYLRTTPFGEFCESLEHSVLCPGSLLEKFAVYNPANRPVDDDSDDFEDCESLENTYYEEIGDVIGTIEPLDVGSHNEGPPSQTWSLLGKRHSEPTNAQQSECSSVERNSIPEPSSKFYVPRALGEWLDARNERLMLGPLPTPTPATFSISESSQGAAGDNDDDFELENDMRMASKQWLLCATKLDPLFPEALPLKWQMETDQVKTAIEGLDIINGTHVVVHYKGGPIDHWFPLGFGLLGNSSISPGIKFYYYEVEILDHASGDPTFGFKQPQTQPPGDIGSASANQWALACSSRKLIGPRGSTGTDNELTDAVLEKGAVIGCGLDFVNETVFFTVNGVRLRSCFRGVKADNLTPYMSVFRGDAIRTNFGQYGFRYDVAETTKLKADYWSDLIERLKTQDRYPQTFEEPRELKAHRYAEKVCLQYLRDRGFNSTLAKLTGEEPMVDSESKPPHALWAQISQQLEQGKFVHVLDYLEQQGMQPAKVFEPLLLIQWMSRCYVQLIEERAPIKLIIETARIVTQMANEYPLGPKAKTCLDSLHTFVLQPEMAVADSWIRSKELDAWLSLTIQYKIRRKYSTLLTSVEQLLYNEHCKLLTTTSPFLGLCGLKEMGL